jgi:hypothetical protein
VRVDRIDKYAKYTDGKVKKSRDCGVGSPKLDFDIVMAKSAGVGV